MGRKLGLLLSCCIAVIFTVTVQSYDKEFILTNTMNGWEHTSMDFLSNRLVCPGDNNQTCADGYTCCMSPSGDYACCPHENAVCCADHIHCCPKGSSCDTGRCKKDVSSSNSVEFITNIIQQTKRSICPGDEFRCPLETTCCKLSGGKLYGCCPFEEALCCPDELHCCPKGFECSTDATCIRSNSTMPFSNDDLN
ncbi:progranulin-like [Daphnia carinata]|uniref:progranulin-like n=1 Tax=Daphnia carinata TaxID=120202 RepID=UPI00257E51F6|nr:progranulin-like [Daphnia carinata]